MKVVAVTLLLVTVVMTRHTQSQRTSVIDNEVQAFRREYRKFQKDSFLKIERAFFELYNTLNLHLSKITEMFKGVSCKWNITCESIKRVKFDEQTEILKVRLCFETSRLIQKVKAERKKGLMGFFSEELTTTSTLGLFLEKLFTFMELQMIDMWKIYMKNASCVAPKLKEYIASYEILIENAIFLNNETMRYAIPKQFSEAIKASAIFKHLIMKCINNIGNCSTMKNNYQSCLRKEVIFVEYF